MFHVKLFHIDAYPELRFLTPLQLLFNSLKKLPFNSPLTPEKVNILTLAPPHLCASSCL